jgi:crotonobetainyl-CoA:carnitine CoA-transferase CaiB-like acyl-CoA transferase
MQVLAGIRILDLTRHMSGPYATALLTDYGAEVIKIESADGGDPSRSTGSARHGSESALYLMWNRGKRSVALNLRTPEALDVIKRLAAQSDVFVENYRPGVAEEMGLGYETLHEINPRLIYISVSGFGRGPLETWPATDPVIQAMSGVMSVTGEIGGAPILVGVPIADYAGAMQVIQSVTMGLLAREKTGTGQLIEVSMLHALMAALTTRLAQYWATGAEPKRLGGAHSAVAPYNVLPTQDGFMVAGVWGAGEAWPRFCEAIGRPDLVDDPRFLNNELRVAHRDVLVPLLEKITSTAPTEVWEARFRKVHVLFGPVLNFPHLLSHPHVRAAGIVTSVNHPTSGEIPQLSPTLRMSGTPGRIAGPPPLLGQHTVEVLHELGFTPEQIKQFAADGIARGSDENPDRASADNPSSV